jgi:Ca2+-binding RTX toxin-like protein
MKFSAERETEVREDWARVSLDASADPLGGGTASNGKQILTGDQAGLNLSRTDKTWYTSRYGELGGADTTLTYQFWNTQEEMDASYYVSQKNEGSFFSEADPLYFTPFNEAQRALAEDAIGMWDELIDISIVQGTTAQESDITFGSSKLAAGSGAHAYIPSQNDGIHNIGEFYGFHNLGRISGDVWLNIDEEANLAPLDFGSYARQTMLHELGHAMGLSHSGVYNASQDLDGIPGPDPITYATHAKFYQDSMQYTLMSYFASRETGAGTWDWKTFSYIYPQTPLVHDILSVQQIYGADMSTRNGDTVYGFNSTADNAVFDFSVNKLPVLAIWDGGGNDTLDFSGWTSNSVIDLNPGAFSSGGGSGRPTLEAARVAVGDPDLTMAELDAILTRNGSLDGMLHDNIAIAYGATIENAVGGGGDDVITGNSVGNNLVGNNGNDSIDGGAGNDILKGNNGVDTLLGGAGDDRLEGGNGDDVLNGGAGADRLLGGSGVDTYVFDANSGTDTIEGLAKGDRIDLSAFGTDDEVGINTSQAGKIFVDAGNDGTMDLTILYTGSRPTNAMFEYADAAAAGGATQQMQTEYVIVA